MPEIVEFKCPCCGGAIEFNANAQSMKCPYCDSEFTPQSFKDTNEALKGYVNAVESMDWRQASGPGWRAGEEEGLVTYICNSCGGEIIADENTAATKCPFCDSPVVMSGKLSGTLKPDYVIPFKLDKKQAIMGYKNHLSGKRLLPKVFKDENHIEEIKGIYVPFWIFDADAKSHATYSATRLRSWSDSKFNYTETSYYSVVREGGMTFEHIPVDGSSKMPDSLMESIEPYDFSQAVYFETAYLSGYLADKYDVPAASGVNRVNERIRTTCAEELRRTVTGYATAMPTGSGTTLGSSQVKYALYPVWILNTVWNGQKYTFAMNGQTGKFVGNLPLDRGAYYKWLFGLTAAVGAAAFLILTVLSFMGG